jgi:hypothetical protein
MKRKFRNTMFVIEIITLLFLIATIGIILIFNIMLSRGVVSEEFLQYLFVGIGLTYSTSVAFIIKDEVK